MERHGRALISVFSSWAIKNWSSLQSCKQDFSIQNEGSGYHRQRMWRRQSLEKGGQKRWSPNLEEAGLAGRLEVKVREGGWN
jgi:hypothetical protein